MLSDEQFAGRIAALGEGELFTIALTTYKHFSTRRESVREVANRRLTLLHNECQARSRFEIYRDAGDRWQKGRRGE